MRCWLACAAIACAVLGCQSPHLAVYHPEIGTERVHYTRVVLRTSDGVHMRSSNVLALRQLVPLGSPARVTEFSEGEVEIEINKLRHVMYPVGGRFDTSREGVEEFLAKYFVSDPSEVSPESLGPEEIRREVLDGRVLKGMTKAQVYAALGPPQWIEPLQHPTLRMSRGRILRSDHWVYIDSQIIADVVPQKVVYVFEEGELVEITS